MMQKTLPRRALAALLTVLLVVSLVPAAWAAEPTVRLNATSLTIPLGTHIAEKDQAKLIATVTDSDAADATNLTVAWSVDPAGVVEVKGTGNTVNIVTAGDTVTSNTATVTATYKKAGKDYTATCEVTVDEPVVTELEVKLYTDKDCTEELTGDLSMEVREYKTIYAKVTPTWSDGKEGTEDYPLLKNKLTWNVNGGKGTVDVSTGFPQTGICAIVLNARSENATGTDITVKATYENRNKGTSVPSEDVTCKVTVGSVKDVVITEYGVKTREVNLTLGDSNNPYKELKAYLAENDTWTGTDDIAWSVYKDGKQLTDDNDMLKIETRSGGVVRITPKKADSTGTLKLRATHKSSNAFSEVVCIIKPFSSGSDPGGDDTNPPTTDDVLPSNVTVKITISTPASPHTMDPGSETVNISVAFIKKDGESEESYPGKLEWSRGGSAVAVYAPTENDRYELPVVWSSSDQEIAEVTGASSRYIVTADQPGEATLTVSVRDKNSKGASAELKVTVKGFKLKGKEFTVYENGSLDLEKDNIVGAFGGANYADLACWSDDSTVAAYVGGKIAAYKPGTTTFSVSDPNRGFRDSFTVTVLPDPNATIPQTGSITIKSTETLEFADLLSSFRRQAGGKLAYITGINLNSSGGTLYYKYNPATGSGTGVGAENYYHPYSTGGVPYGQRSLEELTFVPKENSAGLVTINYTGVSEDGKNYVCKLLVTVDPESGSSAGISLSTNYNTPLRLSGDAFSRVCRERLGSRLDYVTFSQPPERQGTLYTDYVDAGNYGRRVEMGTHYDQKAIDSLWFVPAPGYSGTVTVYYTAFGKDGNSFASQVDIVVNPENGVAIGGLTYDIAKGGVARFDDGDFERYCRQVLDYSQSLSYIRFDALPAESEGVLYTGYSSVSNPGSRAATGTTYYYGSRTPRIDQLAFVPAADFVGTVKIPFTGCTVDGTRFNGNVEVNVRSGVAVSVGDITYVCGPGRTVYFDDTDFNRLSREVTGSSLNYITFRSLPSSSSGVLYYNNARANTSTNYRNGSSTPRIDNLSFTASNRFSGTVDIPFTGRATNGDTFRGVVTIGSSSSALNGSGGSSGSSGSGNWGGGASSTIFTDMGGYSDVQRAAVDFLYNRNITRGLTTTQYGPQNSIRRGDFARMLYQAFSFGPGSGAQVFVDVPTSAYYAEAVNALYSRGVVSGVGGGFYAPDSTLTRQDAICMVQRAMRAAGRTANDGNLSALYSFSDGGSVSGYAQGAMAFAVQNGYLPTYGGWLNPTQALTRIDMAEILYRVLA